MASQIKIRTPTGIVSNVRTDRSLNLDTAITPRIKPINPTAATAGVGNGSLKEDPINFNNINTTEINVKMNAALPIIDFDHNITFITRPSF
jgi:hypothetical protein